MRRDIADEALFELTQSSKTLGKFILLPVFVVMLLLGLCGFGAYIYGNNHIPQPPSSITNIQQTKLSNSQYAQMSMSGLDCLRLQCSTDEQYYEFFKKVAPEGLTINKKLYSYDSKDSLEKQLGKDFPHKVDLTNAFLLPKQNTAAPITKFANAHQKLTAEVQVATVDNIVTIESITIKSAVK